MSEVFTAIGGGRVVVLLVLIGTVVLVLLGSKEDVELVVTELAETCPVGVVVVVSGRDAIVVDGGQQVDLVVSKLAVEPVDGSLGVDDTRCGGGRRTAGDRSSSSEAEGQHGPNKV